MDIKKFANTSEGRIIISCLLGFGLACCFRASCGNGKCIVIKGPKLEEVQKYYYKMEDNCYKYVPKVIECKIDS